MACSKAPGLLWEAAKAPLCHRLPGCAGHRSALLICPAGSLFLPGGQGGRRLLLAQCTGWQDWQTVSAVTSQAEGVWSTSSTCAGFSFETVRSFGCIHSSPACHWGRANCCEKQLNNIPQQLRMMLHTAAWWRVQALLTGRLRHHLWLSKGSVAPVKRHHCQLECARCPIWSTTEALPCYQQPGQAGLGVMPVCSYPVQQE